MLDTRALLAGTIDAAAKDPLFGLPAFVVASYLKSNTLPLV